MAVTDIILAPAIARIDRMGQTRSTEGKVFSPTLKAYLTTDHCLILSVYCYFATDTVEQNILDLGAKQGQSLYTKENSVGTLNIEAFGYTVKPGKDAIDSPHKRMQKGDFVFKCVLTCR